MTAELMDWDGAYRDEGPFIGPPPWNIGEPQPEFATLIDGDKIHGDVLDVGCGHAELALMLAARGHAVVGIDISQTAINVATATAKKRGLANATFMRADATSFSGFDGRFSTVMDSTLFHSLPVEHRDSYLRAMLRAASPGARYFVLVFARAAFRSDSPLGANVVDEEELRAAVSKYWEIDQIRTASMYGYPPQVHGYGVVAPPDLPTDEKGRMRFPAYLLTAHKAG
jgi:SAM-dependent methyltransferase